MNLHRIAGLLVDLGYKYERTTTQAAPYKWDGEERKPDMTIYLSDVFLEEKSKETGFDLNACEYIYTGAAFNSGIIYFGGFMLHSSAVIMDGRAYLFSADSGTGKSTHTELWLKAFGDRARILNDDKPVIRIAKNGVFACGTPWSGKNDISSCENAPLAGICFLERSEENWIKRVEGKDVLGKLMRQTILPPKEAEMNMVLSCIDKVLTDVPGYTMGCNISTDAAIMAHDAMKPME